MIAWLWMRMTFETLSVPCGAVALDATADKSSTDSMFSTLTVGLAPRLNES